MPLHKTTQSIAAVSRILMRSRMAEIVVMAPAAVLAGHWFGAEGLVIVAVAVLPVALLGQSRDQLRAKAPGGHHLDDVTGLPPRQSIIAALGQAFDLGRISGRKSACLIVSLDETQRLLNDFGQSAHDHVLQKTGERIAGLLRETDLLARLEGDRFALALTPTLRMDLESAIQISVRLKKATAEPIRIDALTYYPSTSVGFCLASRSPLQSGASMLSAAELALEDARRNGPGAIRAYSPEIQHAAHLRDSLRERVGDALDSGEIIAYFQPQLSTDTGEVTGFEALARWNHPERGVLAPAEFMPTIMSNGLSERLSEVMLVNALAALRHWDRTDQRVATVAVNFSREELSNPSLVAKLKWELDRFDIAPNRLAVEILESVVADARNDMVVQNIGALAQMGCMIDLDDFGTGHASIANIRRFAVDRIKIDKTFVAKVDSDPSQQKIVSAVLSMAERLGIATVAEGVESIGEHAILSQLGCSFVQGFAIAHPMPIGDTQAWLHRHRAKLQSTPRMNRRTG